MGRFGNLQFFLVGMLFTACAVSGFLHSAKGQKNYLGPHSILETPLVPVTSREKILAPKISPKVSPRIPTSDEAPPEVEVPPVQSAPVLIAEAEKPEPVNAVHISQPKPPEASSHSPAGILSVGGSYDSTLISSTDSGTGASASLRSWSSFNLGVEYDFEFSKTLEGIFYFSAKQLDIAQPVSSPLISNVINLYSFEAGGRHWFTDDHHLGLGLLVGFEQIPFLKGLSVSQITMDQLTTPQATLDGVWNFIEADAFTFGDEFDFTTYFPTSSDIYQSQFNLGFRDRLYVRQTLSKKFRFELGVSARLLNENTSIVGQQQTDFGGDIKISVPIGGDY